MDGVPGLAAARRATVRVCDRAGAHRGQGLLLDLGADGVVVLTCHHVVAPLAPADLCVAIPREDGRLSEPIPVEYDAARSRPERDAVVLRVEREPAAPPPRPLLHALDPANYAGSLPATGLTHLMPDNFGAVVQAATYLEVPAHQPIRWPDPPAAYVLPVVFRLAGPGDAKPGISGAVVLCEGGVLGLAHFARAESAERPREDYLVPLSVWAEGWPALAERIVPLVPRALADGQATVAPTAPSRPTDSREWRHRIRLLAKARQHWVEKPLEESLRDGPFIPLAMEYRPEAVAQAPARPNRWGRLGHLVRPEAPAPVGALPAGADIAAALGECGGELLILGEPGAGKTTSLLVLARALIGRAEQDPSSPIPIVFSLAAWAARRAPLAAWLVDELAADESYGVPADAARAWVERGSILPLLDGLDEVPLEYRPACVAAIDAFLAGGAERPAGLVVTSRLAEYEALRPVRLRLRGAVLLRSLDQGQIDGYLAATARGHQALQRALRNDATLREMARSPLLLSLMSRVYRDSADGAPSLGDTVEEGRARLFAAYVAEMFARQGEHSRYSQRQILQWLGWLAQQLTRRGHREFVLARMDPSWLQTATQRAQFLAGVLVLGGLLGGLVGTLGGSVAYLLARGMVDRVGRAVAIVVALSVLSSALVPRRDLFDQFDTFQPELAAVWAAVWGLTAWHDMRRARAHTAQMRLDSELDFSWWRALQGFGFAVVTALVAGCVLRGLVLGLGIALVLSTLPGLLYWVFGSGLVVGLVAGAVCLRRPPVDTRRIVRVTLGAAVPALLAMCGLIVALHLGALHIQLRSEHFSALILLSGLAGGLVAADRGGPARTRPGRNDQAAGVTDRARPSGRAPSAEGTLAGSVRPIASVVAIGLAIGLSSLMGLGLALWLSATLLVVSGEAPPRGLLPTSAEVLLWLAMALLFGLVWGLFRGSRLKEVADAVGPDQGLRRALRRSLRVGLISYLVYGATVVLLQRAVLETRSGLEELISAEQSTSAAREAATYATGLLESAGALHPGWAFVLGGISLGVGVAAGFGGLAAAHHFVVRAVLSLAGQMPWRQVQFLEYAAGCGFLYRVGNGYRFAHELWQAYFAAQAAQVGRGRSWSDERAAARRPGRAGDRAESDQEEAAAC